MPPARTGGRGEGESLLEILARWAIWLICILALLSPLWLPRVVSAAPLTAEQARGILYVAYGQYRGPRSLIEDMPKVELVSAAALCRRLNDHPGCGALGVYLGGEDTVLVDEALDFSQLWPTTVLVHEFVHHFQWKLRGPPRSCGEAIARERQAYLIQAELLERVGQLHDAYRAIKGGMMHMPGCPVDEQPKPEAAQ